MLTILANRSYRHLFLAQVVALMGTGLATLALELLAYDISGVLLGHRNGDITSHYSAPELAERLEAAERVCLDKSGKTPALIVLKQKAATGGPVTA